MSEITPGGDLPAGIFSTNRFHQVERLTCMMTHCKYNHNIYRIAAGVFAFCAGSVMLHGAELGEAAKAYLLRPPAMQRTHSPVVLQGIISGEHREAHEFYRKYFDGSMMPIPDYLELRCAISAVYDEDGEFSPAYLNRALKAARDGGVPHVELSLISSKATHSTEIPANMDVVYEARFGKARMPQKLVDYQGVSIENALDQFVGDPGWDRKQFERYSYSFNDPVNRNFILQHIKKTVRYFENSKYADLIQSWHFRAPGMNDWWYPMNNSFYDYSPAAEKEFQTFLQKKYGTLNALNQRYGSNYADFADIKLPQPEFEKLNLKAVWLDFQAFRQQTIVDMQRSEYQSFIAGGGAKKRLVGWMTTAVYTASRDAVILDNSIRLNRDCPGLNMTQTWFDYYDFTGEVYGQLAAQYHVPVGVEPGQMNMQSFLRTFYNAMRFPVKRINWLFCIAANPAEYPWMTWVLNQRPLLDELYAAELIQEPCVNLFSYSDQIATVNADLWDGKGINKQWPFFRLTQDANYNLPMITDYSLEIDLNRYQSMILLDTKLIRPEMLDKIIAFVDGGGTLLVVGEAASYDMNCGEKSFPLLTRLGITNDQIDTAGKIPKLRDAEGNSVREAEWKFGAGRVLFRSRLDSVGEEALNAEDEALLRKLGCKRNVEVSPRKISCFEKRNAGNHYYGFINTGYPSGTKAEVKLLELSKFSGNAVELISGKIIPVVNGKFSLDFKFQYEMSVIKISFQHPANILSTARMR